ncbi:MAG: hypothetical protein KatS3mg013_2108 [Actinomycetota bacterium]|jgi:uncharacterized repeat protein (TIGR03847 family)|nr:MAG: hypothetical protein KatS3mg013_2108 [Actinomycetota bacterium]
MELGPVDRITADAVGEPGARTFFLQARSGPELVTVIVEKQQVQLLAASILELLADVPLETGPGPEEAEMALEEPLEPRWRAGRLSIGYDRERDRFVLEITELEEREGPQDDPSNAGPEPETIRLWATREQMLALSRHGAAVAARGRPTCRLCGNPIDPEGHACPAMNGHSSPRT